MQTELLFHLEIRTKFIKIVNKITDGDLVGGENQNEIY